MKQKPKWAQCIIASIGSGKVSKIPALQKQGGFLKRGIRLLAESQDSLAKDALSLLEQPFDLHLLNCSSLYRRSRQIYLKQGGTFVPTLVSSPRTLSSAILLEQQIEYSPLERELIWSATNPIQSKNLDHLLLLRTYCSSLFHEQNHRILWKFLPSCPPEGDLESLRRFLNFAESLVITLDMALADGLGLELGLLFYLTGVIYDPGSTIWLELSKKRDYRNYLQAAMYSTYLHLEFYSEDQILKIISALFPCLSRFAQRAAIRSMRLDPLFVQNTNLSWQKRNRNEIVRKLFRPGQPALVLPPDPMTYHQHYLIAEKWFERMGL